MCTMDALHRTKANVRISNRILSMAIDSLASIARLGVSSSLPLFSSAYNPRTHL